MPLIALSELPLSLLAKFFRTAAGPGTGLALLGLVSAPLAALELTECRLADSSELRSVAALCGNLSVPMDPQNPDGKQINLFIAKVPALSKTPRTDAFTAVAGGPGAASTEFYASLAAAFSRIRRDRDIVLVDQRGTGRSHPLQCATPDDLDASDYSPEAARAATQECLDQLDADPRYFTTSVAVTDLDRVREALGYETLNLYGVSYGSRVAQHYLRRYPQHTRSVILDGVVPADLPLGPAISLDAQNAVELMFQRCEREPGCAAAFPDLRAGFDKLAEQLAAAPVEVSLPDPLTAEHTQQRLSPTYFQAAVRLLSYSTESLSIVPLVLHRAYAKNDFLPLAAQALMVTRSTHEMLSYGMHNAVVCTEDTPFFKRYQIDRTALERTYLGTLMVDGLLDVCSVWPEGVIDEDFKTPVVSDKPVLILSGSADPVTPPANGARVAGWLSNSAHLVVEGQGHGQAAVGCMPRLLGEFVDTLEPATLDASCLESIGPAPFFTSFAGPEP